MLLTTSEAVVHFLTGTSGSATTCFLFLFLILSIRKTKKSGIKIIEVIMDVTSLYNLITFLSYRVNMIYELWLYFRIKMLFALKNSRNIMEVWTSYCKVISPKFEIFRQKLSVRYCIMCWVLKLFLFQTCSIFLSFKSAIFIWNIDSLEIYSRLVATIKNSARLFH